MKSAQGREIKTYMEKEGIKREKKKKRKKKKFLVVGPLRFYPPYTNGLVVHTTFFLL